MKEMLKDFFKLFSNSITFICLILASFLILINLYHYKEITYKYPTIVSENKKYIDFKKYISDAESKISKIDSVKVSSDFANQKNIAKTEINKCITALKESSMYKLSEKTEVSYYDVYILSTEIELEINNNCLFYMGYNINNITDSKNYNKVKFSNVYNTLNYKKNIIIENNKYITSKLLKNSTYSYVTDTTRSTIFNELAEDYVFVLSNYVLIAQMLEDTTNWYASEYGGAS